MRARLHYVLCILDVIPHARVIPLTETRLNLDNELVLFFGKTCTDEQCTVNKLSELSFLCRLKPSLAL